MISSHEPYDELGRFLGILADASVHFTPEFYTSLNWEVRRTSETDGEIYLDYFQNEIREIERYFMTLVAAHGTNLKVLDRCYECCFQQEEIAPRRRHVLAGWQRAQRRASARVWTRAP